MQVYLAHGASGGVETIKPWIEALTARGLDATAVAVPRGTAERAVPAYLAALASTKPAETIIGGHSFGGRVASMIAADLAVAGLVLLSYPLHRPGRPDQPRNEHWPRIRSATLVLSGESDPFARIELLRASVKSLDNAKLITYPGVGHGLKPVLEDASNRIADFVARVARRERLSE